MRKLAKEQSEAKPAPQPPSQEEARPAALRLEVLEPRVAPSLIGPGR